MFKKIITIIISTLLMCFMAFNFIAFASPIEAELLLSKYVNTNKGAIFNDVVELAPTYYATNYVLGTNAPVLDNEELKIGSVNDKNFLVKINGEYTNRPFVLSKGINNIEVRGAKWEGNKLVPTKEVKEKFNVYVDNKRTEDINIYYEHYNTKEEMYGEIANKTNYTHLLTNYKTNINDAYQKYEEAKIKDRNNYYNTNLDMKIKIYSQKENINYVINMLSAKNPALKEKEERITVDYKYDYVAIPFSKVPYELRGEMITYNKLPKSIIKATAGEHQAFVYEQKKNVNFPSDLPSDYRIIDLEWAITDKITLETVNKSQSVLFYNDNIAKGDYETKIKFKNTELEISKNYNNPYYFIEELTTTINYESENYLVVDNPSSVSFASSLDTSVLTTTPNIANLRVMYEANGVNFETNKNKGVNMNYTVVDKIAPKILTDYNIILLEESEMGYKHHFRVIDNYTYTKDIKTTFEMIPQDEKSGIIKVSAEDKSGNMSEIEVVYCYRQKVGWLKRMMWGYREFFNDMFI